MSKKREFIRQSKKTAFDRGHRKTIRFNMSKYDAAFNKGVLRYADMEQAKERASYLKGKAVLNLGDYLLEFEQKITARGGEVLWARTAEEAVLYVTGIFKERDVRMVVKSKSMTTEEIGLNEYIEQSGIEVVETDLGEYIVQVAGEKPYHIVTPAMHKSKEDVARLFHEKFNTPKKSTPEDLTEFVRQKLREKFTTAGVGITGANFIVADVGGIALTENEGNGMMTFGFPKIHIVIAGIEKVVPSMNDLALMWPLLATHGTGQQISVYNSLVTGPQQREEQDGPERMVVILLDNGRTELLKQQKQFQALKCIRCGACLNFCPIYKNVGGYTYDAVYSGPVGSVITPFYKGMSAYNHLSFACSVCGECTEICPVKIPLHDLLLQNRSDAVESGHNTLGWRMGLKGLKYVLKKRKRLDATGGGGKNLILRFTGNAFGGKKPPVMAKESFSKQWKKRTTKK